MKTCTKCGVEKDELEFHRYRRNKDGLKSWCKPCNTRAAVLQYNQPAALVTEKECIVCHQVLPVDKFYLDKRKKDGVYPKCKTCHSYERYRYTYGLSRAEVKALLSQGCEACGDTVGRIVIDHCHTTGKVRGALCSNCNTSLGLLGEDPLRMNNLANYIIRKTITD